MRLPTRQEITEVLQKWLSAIGSKVTEWRTGETIEPSDRQKDKPVPLADLPDSKELEERCSTMPRELLDVLRPEPLGGGSKFFAGREKELQVFRGIMEHWKQSHPRLVALAGPPGSGRTTLMRQLQSEIVASEHVSQLVFDGRIRTELELIKKLVDCFEITEDCHSVKDLVRRISTAKRRVILVDDAQFLFLRDMGGFQAIQAFLSILVATQDRFLWVVGFSEYAWRRLDYILELHRYFTDVIHLAYLSQEDFMQALHFRLEAFSMPLVMEEDPSIKETSDAQSSSEDDVPKKEFLPDLFAKDLYQISKGNMHAALYFWKYFSCYDGENKRLMIRKKKEIDYSALKDLDRTLLFTLGELVAHGCLTLEEHAGIFQTDPLISRQRLDHLSQRQFVDKFMPEDNKRVLTYVVDPVFYLPVSSTLESAHILY